MRHKSRVLIDEEQSIMASEVGCYGGCFSLALLFAALAVVAVYFLLDLPLDTFFWILFSVFLGLSIAAFALTKLISPPFNR